MKGLSVAAAEYRGGEALEALGGPARGSSGRIVAIRLIATRATVSIRKVYGCAGLTMVLRWEEARPDMAC